MDFSYYQADPTGVSPDYADTAVYTLYRTGQIVEFRVPIYAKSLTFTIVGQPGVTLTQGVDYTIDESNYDDTAMSAARNTDSTFTDILIKTVTITRASGLLPLEVQASYQMFYLTTPSVPILGGAGGVELTPDLVLSMLADIAAIRKRQVTIESNVAPTLATPQLLDLDINCTNPDNVITGEVHTVDTFNGKNIIRPVNGAFFPSTLSLSVAGTPLVLGTDYDVRGCLISLTQETTETSGVYEKILIIKELTDPVSIDYHALGGTPSTQAMADISSNLDAVSTFLLKSDFLTTEGLQSSDTIRTICSTINSLDKKMRQLLSTPTYGDATTGTAVTKPLRTTDFTPHWWTVGSLYKVGSLPDLIKADRMKLRVRLVSAKYQCDLAVSVDLDNIRNPLTVTAENVVWDNGMDLYGAATSIAPIVPMARIIYRQTTGGYSGILLQLSFSLPGLTDRLALEDFSGVESCWLLDRTDGSGTALLPNDTKVTLPDGSVWDSADPLCKEITTTLQAPSGHFLFGGSIPFSTFDSSATTPVTPLNIYMPSYFRLSDVKTLDVHITNAAGDRFIYTIPAILSADATALKATGIIILDSGAESQGTLLLDVDQATWTITPKILGISGIVDQFALRYIVAHV